MRSLIALLLLCFAFAAQPSLSSAQSFNLDSLFNQQPEESLPQSQTPPVQPSESLQTTGIPSAADYGQLTTSNPMLGQAQSAISLFRSRLIEKVQQIPEIWPELVATLRGASITGKPSYFLGVALFTVLLLMIGRGVSWLYQAYIARPLFVSLQRPNPQGYRDKLPVLAYRVFFTMIGVAIAVAVASVIGLFFYQEHEPTALTVIAIFAVYTAFMAIETIWRMALAPFLADYRLPSVGDRGARKLYRWLVGISVLGIVSTTLTVWLQALEINEDIRVLMIILFNLLIILVLMTAIRLCRGEISQIIMSGRTREEASWVTLIAVQIWAPITVLYFIIAWGKLSFHMIMGIPVGEEAMLIPYVVLMTGLLAYAFTAYLIERAFAPRRPMAEIIPPIVSDPDALDTDGQPIAAKAEGMDFDGDGDEEGGGAPIGEEPISIMPMRRRRGMRSFEDLARRVASLFAIGAAAWALFYYWGGPKIFAENAVLGIAEDLIDILFIGYIAYHAVRIWIDKKIEEEIGDEDEMEASPLDGEGGGTGATRLATLLPLVRNFILVIILIAIGLVVATELGVNVAPLFAGAGVVGLAIGFGSQTLVRDILSGAFFLVDDAFRKGEYIDVGDVKGTVEKISLRSFQLRHHLGALHTIPFGEIQYLTNFSRDWVMMKLPLRVTYDTDVEKVRKLIKKLGQQLLEDPVVGENFIQPLKSQGVIQMDDSAMIIRVKFMTRPGDQWVVRKRVYAEIRDLFDREGIKFAHREVTVRIPDLPQDRPLSEPEVTAIGAAARRVGDAQAEAMQATGTGGPIDDR
ncbi:MAG: mechanosensitive ion channel family protein [Pseudomonadota bacterium]